MLTIRTAAHIPTSRHRRSFRVSPASTGVPPVYAGLPDLLRQWMRRLNAEARRHWLEMEWRSHLQRVRSTQVRRSP